MSDETFKPVEENLGQNCMWWEIGGVATGCRFPKEDLIGRRGCEGIVDVTCVTIRTGSTQTNLSPDDFVEMELMLLASAEGTLPPDGSA